MTSVTMCSSSGTMSHDGSSSSMSPALDPQSSVHHITLSGDLVNTDLEKVKENVH